MREFKGTKGELRKAKSSRTKVEFSILREDGYQIALVESSYIGSDSETVANADLFIAAPKLLNASIKMSKAISDGNNMLLSEANLEMKIAINKALGNNDKK
jgi:hypothetical protein